MKIVSIEEVNDLEVAGYGWRFDGWVIKTTGKEIKVLVDNDASCCESWGMVTCEEDIQQYIGADVIEVSVTDMEEITRTIYNGGQSIDNPQGFVDGGDMIFVTLHTSVGSCQFGVYNEHNGYYGHTAVVFVGEEKVKEKRL